ncbi:VOC family protein [uncultured Duncaniella sp.]|uniref:VOC family protein n=1 Tax=uncultured Duncaniella sp. TaxID=2768039 RepID=UPI0023D566FA|nr:VOC family protein [uncultured Duncaniella sp.]MDE5665186.1 VOC family protein [Duncaniella sp.]MDE6186702.1 VOC family protein [Duncaniella sp.]
MDFKLHFDHYNINVADRDRSMEFYRKALGLKEVGHIDGPDGAFTITYMGDGSTGFRLELTCMRDHPQPYDLGENETHLALRLEAGQDYERLREFHRQMGVVCYENPAMGIYFIEDPDGYWIELLRPEKL